jgi:hypothetical protein
MKRTCALAAAVFGAVAALAGEPGVPPPEGERYETAKWTQRVAVTNGRDTISPVPRSGLEAHWQTSGGMVGIAGVVSEKFKVLPPGGKTWIGNIQVWNGGGYQSNRGIVRSYPDGTRFEDRLSYRGVVFEVRVRVKRGGVWKSSVTYSSAAARPPGYRGLGQSCASCHDQAGTGGYAAGLVPGGDGVLSEELDWSLVR